MNPILIGEALCQGRAGAFPNQEERYLRWWSEQRRFVEMRDIALEKVVEFSRNPEQTYLDLSYLNLSDIDCLLVFYPLFPRLETLILQGNQLQEMPPWFFLLTSLQVINLAENRIEWIDEGLFSSLEQVKVLNLRQNLLTSFSGSLLGSSLEVLNLSQNQLIQLPEEIGYLPLLKELFVDHNRLIVVPFSLQKAKKLTLLSASGNQLEMILFNLAELESLQVLHLSSNRIHTLYYKTPRVISCLEVVNLEKNLLSQIPEGLLKAPYLRKIYLGHNKLTELPLGTKGVNLFLPPCFSFGSHLEVLDLSHNQISEFPIELSHLENVYLLNLSFNRLQRVYCLLSACFNRLDSIHLEGNKLRKIPGELLNAPQLRYLNLSNNQLQEIPDGIGMCLTVKKICIAYNQLVKISPWLVKLPQLEALILQGNQIKELDFSLGGSRSLTQLDLSQNAFETWPEGLSLAPCLKELNLACNRIEKVSETAIQLQCLERISLECNRLNVFPRILFKLPKLKECVLKKNCLHPMDIPPEVIERFYS